MKIKVGSLEVNVSRVGRHNGKVSADCIWLLFWIFALVCPFFMTRRKVVWQHRKGVTPSPVHLRICAQKSRMTTCHILAESQKL